MKTKADLVDDIAVFFARPPRPSLVCNGTVRQTSPRFDHNQGTLSIAVFAPECCPPPSKEEGDNTLDSAVYP